MFSCEFCKISKNTFIHRTPPVAASRNLMLFVKNIIPSDFRWNALLYFLYEFNLTKHLEWIRKRVSKVAANGRQTANFWSNYFCFARKKIFPQWCCIVSSRYHSTDILLPTRISTSSKKCCILHSQLVKYGRSARLRFKKKKKKEKKEKRRFRLFCFILTLLCFIISNKDL